MEGGNGSSVRSSFASDVVLLPRHLLWLPGVDRGLEGLGNLSAVSQQTPTELGCRGQKEMKSKAIIKDCLSCLKTKESSQSWWYFCLCNNLLRKKIKSKTFPPSSAVLMLLGDILRLKGILGGSEGVVIKGRTLLPRAVR